MPGVLALPAVTLSASPKQLPIVTRSLVMLPLLKLGRHGSLGAGAGECLITSLVATAGRRNSSCVQLLDFIGSEQDF